MRTLSPAIIAPTDSITKDFEIRVIDGVEIEFQLAPESEAPVEMHLFFPGLRALNTAENATHTLHNLLPLRGSPVRDAHAWSGYINRAIHRYGPAIDVVFAQHHRPVWENANIINHLSKQRDLYKFIHDQTLRLAAHGFTAPEIAEQLELPPSLEANWAAHGLYGTVNTTPDPLPPVEHARKLIDYIGAENVLHKAREDFANGEYRWVARILNELIHTDASTITYLRDHRDEQANANVTLDHPTFTAFLTKKISLPKALLTGKVRSSGNPLRLSEFFGLLETLPNTFNIITPR